MGARLPLHLLVVDDDDVDRERVLRLLVQSPFKIEALQAASGAEALAMVREHHFDCVVLDHQLGDAEGADLLLALKREALEDCPVIMVTGARSESVAVRALQHGAADYLPKMQLSAEGLLRAIQRSLESHQLKRELSQLQQELEQRVNEQADTIRQRERDQRNILDNAPAMMASWDAQQRLRFGNRAYLAWYAIESEQVPGLAFAALRAQPGPAALASHVAAVLRGEPQHVSSEVTTGQSGEVCHLEVELRPDRGEQGQVLGFYITLTDVTSMREAQAKAEGAARIKAAFLANMSHEIRTPMNAIVGLSRLALEEDLPVLARAHFDKVYSSAVAQMGILDDVLDYSKIEAGQLRFETVVLDLHEIVARVSDLFLARIEQKGLRLGIEMEPGLPTRLLGDPLRLSQVLNNLVGNAVKFTEHGRITLGIQRMPHPMTGEYLLRFAVRDSGIGVEPLQQSHLFGAFSQGDSSITRRFGGTGLGLAICKRLVQMMGGEIGVHSQAGQGSEFWFTARFAEVPLGLLPAKPAFPASRMALPVGETAALLRGLRVLLAEDNELNQVVASEFLRKLGVEVQVAANGEEALAMAREAEPGRFALVLMDMHMPRMDGLEATRRLHALPGCQALPVVGMTAAALPEDRTRCLEAGMVDHVAKPIMIERLQQVLLRWARPPSEQDGAG